MVVTPPTIAPSLVTLVFNSPNIIYPDYDDPVRDIHLPTQLLSSSLLDTMQGRHVTATTYIINCDALANTVVDKDTCIYLEYTVLALGPDKEL